VSYGFGLFIESLVAILLLVTIGYCVVLNRRLKRFKADEQSLKATISELITATGVAQRCVAGLKMTARECEATLGERLRDAEACCADLARHVKSGDAIIARLSEIAGATRPVMEVAPPASALAASDPKALAAAAQAFARRARARALAA
jgi:hypothetical protein